MSTDSSKGVVCDAVSTRDLLKGIAFKAGKTDRDRSRAAWPVMPEFGPGLGPHRPERSPAPPAPPPRNSAPRRSQWANLLLAGSAFVFTAVVGWRAYNDQLSARLPMAAAASPTVPRVVERAVDRASVPLQQAADPERARRLDLERQVDALLAA